MLPWRCQIYGTLGQYATCQLALEYHMLQSLLSALDMDHSPHTLHDQMTEGISGARLSDPKHINRSH